MSGENKRTTLRQYIDSILPEVDNNAGLGAVVMAIADGSVRVQQQVQQAALADALGSTGRRTFRAKSSNA